MSATGDDDGAGGALRQARAASGHLASTLGALGSNMALYYAEVDQYPLLQHEEEIALAQAMERPDLLRDGLGLGPRDPDPPTRPLALARQRAFWAREYFICCNLRLVASIARRLGNGDPERTLDLIQEGNVALIRAVELYDWRTGNRFSTYGTPWVRHAIRTARIEYRSPIHLSPQAHQDTTRLLIAAQELRREGVVAPTGGQIAARCGLDPAHATNLLALSRPVVYLSEGFRASSADDGEPLLYDVGDNIEDRAAPDPDGPVDAARLARGLLDCLIGLRDARPSGPREVLTVLSRSGLSTGVPMTLVDAADELGISRERARQHERDAWAYLGEHAAHLRDLLDRRGEVVA